MLQPRLAQQLYSVSKERMAATTFQNRRGSEMAISASTTLLLNDQEKNYLEGILKADLSETRVEVRRTDTPEYHDELRRREEMIRGLLVRIGASEPFGTP